VVAAGGIADGRGVAAAFMLGAQGVQVGTRFLVAEECTVSQEYKNRVLKAKDLSTTVTGRRTGHPVRSLKSPFTTRYASIEKETLHDEDLHGLSAGALRKAAQEGDGENGQFMCGQIAGLVTREEPAAAIVADLMAGAEKVLGGAGQWVR
jgi:enoyl-[acyl-carrier protein] reductase II